MSASTKAEATEVIAREVVFFLQRTGQKDGRAAAEAIVSEWHAGHRGAYCQQIAQINGYAAGDIARVIRACKARVAELNTAARDRARTKALAR